MFTAREHLGEEDGMFGVLGCWGGEAMHCHNRYIQDLLSRIGTPHIVLLDLDLNLPGITTCGVPLGSVGVMLQGEEDDPAMWAERAIAPSEIAEVISVDDALTSGRFPELAWTRSSPQLNRGTGGVVGPPGTSSS
ncbi:hypothetical protein [Falsarthrobacter nasiphocae]